MPAIASFLRVSPRTIDNMATQDGSPKWYQFNVSRKTFSVAATTANFDVTMPRGTLIQGAFVRVRQDFLGGAISAATLSVGSTASPALYVAAVTVFTGSPKTLPGLTIVPGTFVASTAAAVIRVQLLVTSANASVLTQGNADVFLMLSCVPLASGG